MICIIVRYFMSPKCSTRSPRQPLRWAMGKGNNAKEREAGLVERQRRMERSSLSDLLSEYVFSLSLMYNHDDWIQIRGKGVHLRRQRHIIFHVRLQLKEGTGPGSTRGPVEFMQSGFPRNRRFVKFGIFFDRKNFEEKSFWLSYFDTL